MKYLSIIFFFGCYTHVTIGQTVADFENFLINVDTFLNGKNANGGFESGDVIFSNDYNPQFDAWTGFAISSETDNMSGGFANQYASIAGAGADGSQNYAVAYAFDPIVVRLVGNAKGKALKSCSITNNTFAYYSMLNGDQFSKKFGGANGDEPDFFKLTLRAYLDGQLKSDSLEIYLADFRFQEDSLDYILDEWSQFDLSDLGRADSLQLSLSSSDVGGFGMNTPAYFCIDNVVTEGLPTSNADVRKSAISLYPNPANDCLFFKGDDGNIQSIEIFDNVGKRIFSDDFRQQVGIQSLKPGSYFVRLKSLSEFQTLPFIKLKE